MAWIKTRQFLLDSCTAFEHLLIRLLPLPPSWVIPSHSFLRDTGFSYIDWKPRSQRSWCRMADNTIASNSFCSTVQTEAAFSVILLNPHIRCIPPDTHTQTQITLRISDTVCYSFPHLRGQLLWYFSVGFFKADPLLKTSILNGVQGQSSSHFYWRNKSSWATEWRSLKFLGAILDVWFKCAQCTIWAPSCDLNACLFFTFHGCYCGITATWKGAIKYLTL